MNYKLFLIEELEDQDVSYGDVGRGVILGGEPHALVAWMKGEDRRWSRTDVYVVQDTQARNWAIPYERGLPEAQDYQGFADHVADHSNPIHVKAWEVRPVPVHTITWEAVK